MKLGQLVSDKFQAALNNINQVPLPIGTAYALKGISRTIRTELLKYEEARMQALLKYGEKNDKGDLRIDEKMNIVLDTQQKDEFIKDLEVLMNTEILLPKATLDIVKCSDCNISAEDLITLESILEIK